MKNPKIKDCRCRYCQKLLFRGLITKAIIEIKCKSCKHINEISEDNYCFFFTK